MKVYHLLILALLGLAAATVFTGQPSAKADTPEIAITQVDSPPAYKLAPSATIDIDYLRAIPRNEIPHLQSSHLQSSHLQSSTPTVAIASATPTVNTVTLIMEAFSRLGQQQGVEASYQLAHQPFNQGVLALGKAGYLTGHDTLAILHQNNAKPLEQRYTGFQTTHTAVQIAIVPSHVSIHSEQVKLARAHELYGSQPF